MKFIKIFGPVIFVGVANCTATPKLNDLQTSNHLNSEINTHTSEETYSKIRLTSESNVKKRVENMNKFSFSLFNKIATNETNKNISISPLSIQTAFSLIYPSASQEAAEEIVQALIFGADQELFHQSMHDYIESLSNSFGKSEWTLTNQVWVDREYTVKTNYLNTIKSYYNAGVNSLDFQNKTESSRSAINTYVSDKTNQLIKEILPNGSISNSTVLVLTNTIYMLADWENPFDPYLTKKNDKFTKQDGTTLSVDMMNSKGSHNYADLGDYKVLSLDYANSEIAMLWVLPKEDIPLSTFQQNFTATKFSNSLLALEKKNVSLKLPKFSIEWGATPLKDWLESLGMKKTFSMTSNNFPNLLNNFDNVRLSNVYHKTKVIVDEKGTEAAAATAANVGITSVGPQPVPFFVDRPAMFLIYDKVYGGIIFMGRLENP
jgi:serpin B